MKTTNTATALPRLAHQRSHILFALSDVDEGRMGDFEEWYQRSYKARMSAWPGVISACHYKQHDVDITAGKYPRLPFRYLALYELSLDGAEQATPAVELIEKLHQELRYAKTPATWLYYPASEKVGNIESVSAPMLTLAFANGHPGREDEFREWYATRHIRHALNIPALITGQTFERTQFQRPGAMDPPAATIAVYEQIGTPESILECFENFPEETFRFPSMDMSRFSESVYARLPEVAV